MCANCPPDSKRVPLPCQPAPACRQASLHRLHMRCKPGFPMSLAPVHTCLQASRWASRCACLPTGSTIRLTPTCARLPAGFPMGLTPVGLRRKFRCGSTDFKPKQAVHTCLQASRWASRCAWWRAATCTPPTACTRLWAGGRVSWGLHVLGCGLVGGRAGVCMYTAVGWWEGELGLRGPAFCVQSALTSACQLAASSRLALCPLPCSARLWRLLHAVSGRVKVASPCNHLSIPDRPAKPPPPHPLPAGKFGLIGWLRMLLVSYFSNLVGAPLPSCLCHVGCAAQLCCA